jgi:hypothetical protein
MTTSVPESDIARRNRIAKEDSNWVNHPDVDYVDLEHFLGNCRRLKDVESFDTAIRILQAIKRQVTERK